MNQTKTLSVLVENQPGVLARVAGLVARRNYNIESLAVGPTEDANFSRMTIVVAQDQTHIEQIIKQLYKLINVIKITELEDDDSVERELMLIKVRCVAEKRATIIQLAEIFHARIADVGADALTIEMSGTETELSDFIALCEPYGILELARTGRVGLQRSDKRTAML